MSTELPAAPFSRAPLPYESLLDQRPLDQVDLVVMHCTELPDLAMAREFGERVLYETGTGNSGHFYIDRDGSAHCYVQPGRVANHTRGYNPRSIGIELCNRGRFPDWLDSRRQEMAEAYPPAQLQSMLNLLAWLRLELPGLRYLAGHEDLDTTQVAASDDTALRVFRKRDPGPLFPWQSVIARSGLERLAAAD